MLKPPSIFSVAIPVKKNILFTLLILLFVSCEKEAHVKLPPVKEKLVINSFISPQDTILRVFVGKSTPVFGTKDLNIPIQEQNGRIKDAKVTISDGIKLIQLEYDSAESKYLSKKNELLIETGKEYFLEVTALGQTAKASCIVPDPTPIVAIKLDTLDKRILTLDQEYIFTTIQINAIWKDLFQWKNYYRIYGEMEFSEPRYPQDPTTKYMLFNFENDFINDVEEGSGDFSRKGKANLYIPTDPDSATNMVTKIHTYLITSDKNYFSYHKWYNNNDDENPFVEPTLTPTNIQEGLGVFAAYNKSQFIYEVQ
jgi:hypothetical protein